VTAIQCQFRTIGRELKFHPDIGGSRASIKRRMAGDGYTTFELVAWANYSRQRWHHRYIAADYNLMRSVSKTVIPMTVDDVRSDLKGSNVVRKR
jgi:hypothetical protein